MTKPWRPRKNNMKIRELLQSKETSFSCELFPPKQGGELQHAREIAARTAALGPDFISVTYGAAGSNSENTLEVARAIQDNQVTALAHLTCVCTPKDMLKSRLQSFAAAGMENVLALRGDLPEGHTAPGPGCPQHASELVKLIKDYGEFCVGGACYPEGHVESASQQADIRYIKEKVDAGCDFLTTQMFFDNSILYRFLYKLLARGVDVPVLAGIMPVTNHKQITRIVKLSGTVLPPRFLSILDRFGGDDQAMQQAGIAYATEQIIDLIANGVRGIHLYTMNQPEIAVHICANLSCILKTA